MQDCVVQTEDSSFRQIAPDEREFCLKATLGIREAWFVGRSRDSFKKYEDNNYTGVEVYNSCGSFVLAVKK